MVGNLNNYVVNGLKEWVKTFVGVVKLITKSSFRPTICTSDVVNEFKSA
jgi:hypothetical protein